MYDDGPDDSFWASKRRRSTEELAKDGAVGGDTDKSRQPDDVVSSPAWAQDLLNSTHDSSNHKSNFNISSQTWQKRSVTEIVGTRVLKVEQLWLEFANLTDSSNIYVLLIAVTLWLILTIYEVILRLINGTVTFGLRWRLDGTIATA